MDSEVIVSAPSGTAILAERSSCPGGVGGDAEDAGDVEFDR